MESLDSVKLADKLQSACAAVGREPLSVFVQVNTSGEDSKSGVAPGQETLNLVAHVRQRCPLLRFAGLMTIGKLDHVSGEYFDRLASCRAEVCAAEGLDPQSVELSMGMSGDFELAMRHGSTNIRVGSSIFGARVYPPRPASPPLAHGES